MRQSKLLILDDFMQVDSVLDLVEHKPSLWDRFVAQIFSSNDDWTWM